MRFIPNTISTNAQFNDGARPPLELLPKALADIILTRDRIMAQRQEANTHAAELAAEHREVAARQADDDAAAQAARDGKPVPAPKALPELQEERTIAERAAQAQQAAFDAVTNECDTLAGKAYWDNLPKAQAEQAKVRAQIEDKANKLADAVEAAALAHSVTDWMRSGVYHRGISVWPIDVLPSLSRNGIDRRNAGPVDVRSIITTAATTVLDQEN